MYIYIYSLSLERIAVRGAEDVPKSGHFGQREGIKWTSTRRPGRFEYFDASLGRYNTCPDDRLNARRLPKSYYYVIRVGCISFPGQFAPDLLGHHWQEVELPIDLLVALLFPFWENGAVSVALGGNKWSKVGRQRRRRQRCFPSFAI